MRDGERYGQTARLPDAVQQCRPFTTGRLEKRDARFLQITAPGEQARTHAGRCLPQLAVRGCALRSAQRHPPGQIQTVCYVSPRMARVSAGTRPSWRT